MGRRYIINYSAAISAAKDLIGIAAPSTKVVKICGIRVEQSTDYGDAAAEGLRLQFSRGTAGSGGSAVTARPVSPSDTAFAGTVLAENSTALTSPVVLLEGGMNIQAGWLWQPVEKFEIELAPSAACALILVTAPADSITFEIDIEIEELG